MILPKLICTSAQCPDTAKPILGLFGGIASYAVGLIGSTSMPDMAWLFEAGGMVALVGFLSWGLVALWKTRGEERERLFSQLERERKAAELSRELLITRLDAKDEALSRLNQETREAMAKHNQELCEALEKLSKSVREG